MHSLYAKITELYEAHEAGDFEWEVYEDSNGEPFDEEIFIAEMMAYLDPESPLEELSDKQAIQIDRMWEKYINDNPYYDSN